MSRNNVFFLVLLLLTGGTSAQEAGESSQTVAGPSVPQPNGEVAHPARPIEPCLGLDGRPLSINDCATYEAQLETLSRIAALKKKVQEAGPSLDGQGYPPPEPKVSQTPIPAMAARPRDEVIEIYGDRALLRWQGASVTARVGDVLPGGSRVASIEGHTVTLVAGGKSTAVTLVRGEP